MTPSVTPQYINMITRIILFCVACSVAAAGSFNRQPAGLIKGARLSWVSGTTIKVGVGFGENAGEYWEIVPEDAYATTGYALTGLTTSANGVFQYLYIDKANSLFPSVALSNSMTAPAWRDIYMGWYNGQNRCVGAIWIKPDGNLVNFICPQDDVYRCTLMSITSTGGVSTTWPNWNAWDCSSFVPVNAYEISAECTVTCNGPTFWAYCTAALKTGTELGTDRYEYSSISASVNDWLPLGRGAAREVLWQAFAQSTNGWTKRGLHGYKIER